MNEIAQPQNWQTAASIILDATFDLAATRAVADCPDIDACFEAVVREFEYLVEELFNDNGYELDGPLEHISDIAAYALHGYAKVSKTTRAGWRRLMDQYLTAGEHLRGVILLVDSRGTEAHDATAFDWLRESGHPPILLRDYQSALSASRAKAAKAGGSAASRSDRARAVTGSGLPSFLAK